MIGKVGIKTAALGDLFSNGVSLSYSVFSSPCLYFPVLVFFWA